MKCVLICLMLNGKKINNNGFIKSSGTSDTSNDLRFTLAFHCVILKVIEN